MNNIFKSSDSIEFVNSLAQIIRNDKRFEDGYSVSTYGPYGEKKYSSLYLKDNKENVVGYFIVVPDSSGWKYETGEIEYKEGWYEGMRHLTARLPENVDTILNIIFNNENKKFFMRNNIKIYL